MDSIVGREGGQGDLRIEANTHDNTMTYSFIPLYILPSNRLDIHTEARRQRKDKAEGESNNTKMRMRNESIKHTETIWGSNTQQKTIWFCEYQQHQNIGGDWRKIRRWTNRHIYITCCYCVFFGQI